MIKNIFIAIFLVFVILIVGFFLWLKDSYKTNEYASHYMLSTSNVDVENKDNGTLVFKPRKLASSTGIIIYPGQKIEPKSYARLSNMMANSNYTVFVPKLRFNFSSFSLNLADRIIKENPNIKKWYLVAHSTSGDVALKEAANQKKILGVVFLGSYPSGDDLKLINKPVLSIWGTKDGILDFTKFKEYKSNMPSNAHFYEIVGGNNTNFADIETIPNDNKAIISAEEQQKEVRNEITKFIKTTEEAMKN